MDGCVDPDIARKCHKCCKGAVPSPSIEVCSAVARVLAVEPLQTGTSGDVPRASWMLLQAFEVGGRVEATAALINYVKGYGLLGDIRFNIKGRLLGICWLFPFATVFHEDRRGES